MWDSEAMFSGYLNSFDSDAGADPPNWTFSVGEGGSRNESMSG
jgi:hypothetical protein